MPQTVCKMRGGKSHPTSLLTFLLSLSFFFAFSSSQVSVGEWQTNSTTAIWQGFDHGWEREVAHLFDTPHRLGSFANILIDSYPTSPSSTLEFECNQTFTPGVNGDYAYPKTYFTTVQNVNWQTVLITLNAFDNATSSPSSAPFASLSLPIGFSFQIPASSQEEVAVILNGVRIDMECEEELQPEGETCNSNGIWPVSFSVDAPVCSMTSTSILGCNSSIYLSRACNPDCSIPLVEKPFNFVMSYKFEIGFKIINAEGMKVTSLPSLNITENTKNGMVKGSEVAQGSTMTSSSSALVAIQGFSFTLFGAHPDHHNDNKTGRYLERLSFLVIDSLYSENSNELAFDWQMGYYTVTTTLPSDVTYSLTPLLLQFENNSVYETENSPAAGAVCIDDKLFKCNANIDGVHLRQTTNSLVKVTVDLD